MNFFDFSVRLISGETLPLSTLRGKRVLAVNTASECGFTPQLAQLQELHETFGARSFAVIGFPCNDFGSQEPGTSADIEAFCSVNYGVRFLVTEKIHIRGEHVHPVFEWLQLKAHNGIGDFPVTWNFQKFCISPTGTIEKVIAPSHDANETSILRWIQQDSLF